jgi:hypothetical protein
MNEHERHLDELLARLEIERAPASLTHRLRRIPAEQQTRGATARPWWSRLLPTGAPLRWAAAPALAAALIALGVVLLQPRQPSPADIREAREELALAFSYIDQAGLRAGSEISSVLGLELRRTVKENLSRNIPFTEQSRKEETT